MKGLTLSAIALLTVLSAAMASGNEAATSQMKAVNVQNRLIKVLYTNMECCAVKVRLKDERGNLILTDRIKEEKGFMRPYNIELLPAGTYTVELTDQFKTHVEKVTIE